MFSAKQKDLETALDRVLSVVESSRLNFIFDCVLLRLQGNDLELTGSDGQVQITTHCEVEKSKSDEKVAPFAVKAKKFKEILRHIGNSKIQFKRDSGNLTISSKAGRFKLELRDGGEFPRMERTAGEDLKVTIDQASLLSVLKCVQTGISAHNHRIYLSGAYFDFLEDGLHIVATDGHRLATDVIEAKAKEGNNFILPRKAVAELQRLLDPNGKEPIELTAKKSDDKKDDKKGDKEDDRFRTACFSTSQLELSSQLINGQYPNYSRVIPDAETNNVQCLFDRVALLAGVRKVCAVHDKPGDPISIIFSSNATKAELTAKGSSSPDEAHVEVPMETVKVGESDINCQVNSAYLQDLLASFDGHNRVMFAFKDSASSILCLPGEDQKARLRYVVMPVR